MRTGVVRSFSTKLDTNIERLRENHFVISIGDVVKTTGKALSPPKENGIMLITGDWFFREDEEVKRQKDKETRNRIYVHSNEKEAVVVRIVRHKKYLEEWTSIKAKL